MRPSLHPRLVNGRFGDPALFVERLHRREALLFDLGDLAALPARDLLRVGQVCVSHMHIDHLIGFDALLRVNVGREKRIEMVGPAGFVEAIGHKLAAYSWDLVDRYETELIFDVHALVAPERMNAARFRFKSGFAREDLPSVPVEDGIVLRAPDLEVRAAILAHHGPSLGFAASEPVHVNVWKARLEGQGLVPGPWLQPFKDALRAGASDDWSIQLPDGEASLGELRDLATVSRGQKIAYVTDVADTAENRAAITALAQGANRLFIESRFAAADRALAYARAHLTTTAAGEIARAAGALRVEPFHFSPRYEGEEERMLAEVAAALG